MRKTFYNNGKGYNCEILEKKPRANEFDINLLGECDQIIVSVNYFCCS